MRAGSVTFLNRNAERRPEVDINRQISTGTRLTEMALHTEQRSHDMLAIRYSGTNTQLQTNIKENGLL